MAGGKCVKQWASTRWKCFTSSNEREAWKKANNNLFSVLFFMTEGSAQITLRANESKELGCVGDGAAAWNALKERFDGSTNEARRTCREKRFSKSMKPGGEPADFIATMDDLRLRLEDMGEKILDHTYADMMLNSFPKEFDVIEQMHHRDRSFNLEQMKQTAINFYIDDLSRKSSTPPISGRGAAMAAASSSDQCHHCKASGHLRRDCPKLARKHRSNRGKKKDKKSKGGDPLPKWCSYRKTATHSDSQCRKQKELQQLVPNLAILR